MALQDTKCLILNKETFNEYLGHTILKQAEKQQFFENCFDNMSRRLIMNFYCMFGEMEFNRGEPLTNQGNLVNCLYLVEEGTVGIFWEDDESLRKKRRNAKNKVEK